MARHQDTWGAKIGPRIAMLVVQAIAYSHGKLHDLKHRLAMSIFHAISDEISEEVDVTLGPFLEKMHSALTPDHPAYPAVNFLYTTSGQLKAMAGTGLQITGLLGSISAIMNNELADSVYGIVGTNPHLLPDPGTVASMAAANLVDDATAVSAIGAQGISQGWASNMLTLARTYPALADGLEMMRRGIATRDQVALWLGLNGVPEDIVGLYLGLEVNLLSPADAALAVLRGNLTQDQGLAIAVQNGLTPDSFQTLINNTGEPPGTDQLLEAYRRGFIDKATLERGILQSRYRDEWIPTIEDLRYSPLTTADAVDAVVQNHLTTDQATSIADQNGLEPGAITTLIATAGEPLSRTEMTQLYNRGQATKADFLQALAESRLKDKYGDQAFDLHVRLIDPGAISEAVVYGAMSHDVAVSKMLEIGYAPDDAATLVAGSSNRKLQDYRDRVVQSAEAMYVAGAMSQADATSAITSVGYSDAEATLILKAADYKRQAHVITTAVGALRTKYLGHHITRNEASGYLDSTGIPASQRDYLLQLWDIERAAYTKVLTEAQIVKAVGNQLITQADGLARLEALGYNETDANLLLNGA